MALCLSDNRNLIDSKAQRVMSQFVFVCGFTKHRLTCSTCLMHMLRCCWTKMSSLICTYVHSPGCISSGNHGSQTPFMVGRLCTHFIIHVSIWWLSEGIFPLSPLLMSANILRYHSPGTNHTLHHSQLADFWLWLSPNKSGPTQFCISLMYLLEDKWISGLQTNDQQYPPIPTSIPTHDHHYALSPCLLIYPSHAHPFSHPCTLSSCPLHWLKSSVVSIYTVEL